MENKKKSAHSSAPKSVMQIADYGGPYSGNFIASLSAVEAELRKMGLRQVMIFSDIAKDKPWLADLQKHNLPLYLLPSNKSVFTLARKIARIAEEENAVILHTHFTKFDVPAWLAGVLMRIKNRRAHIVWHLHSNFPVKRTVIRMMKDRLKLQLMGRWATNIITVSKELRRAIIARGFAGQPLPILNGIDMLRVTTPRQPRYEIRKELEIQEDAVLLLSFGWDPLTKGIDLLLDAANNVSPKVNFNLLVVGEKRLREFIASRFSNGLPAWLRISDPRECVADLFHAADIFISASRWEGCPYSVMEAMANGLLVISSNIGALEWARSSKGVVFFDLGDVVDMSEKIIEVINRLPQWGQSAGIDNREVILARHSVRAWAENIVKYYGELLGE